MSAIEKTVFTCRPSRVRLVAEPDTERPVDPVEFKAEGAAPALASRSGVPPGGLGFVKKLSFKDALGFECGKGAV